jgi:predicted RNA-binding Zn-ribbon protein involved in translation (DUF1610 family)
MIRIVCTSCQKPLSLDISKLPMKEVSFPCPVCKAKIIVDRRQLEAPESAEAGTETPAASTPVAAPPLTADTHGGHDEHDGFGARAIVVGADQPALRQAVKLIGFLPVFFAEAEKAREYFMQEFPQVVIVSPPALTAPPLESMQPIIALTPTDRRKAFVILIADGLRTLDGNAAFLYGVNLVVAMKDLTSFPQIYRDAHAYHERLYAPMSSVLKTLHT